MTAYGDVGQAVKAMQLGANDYLMKPFELKELEALLRPYNPVGAALNLSPATPPSAPPPRQAALCLGRARR